MKDIELQDMWKAYDQQLEQSRVLNLQSWVLQLKSFEMMQTFKAKSRLSSLSSFKQRAVAFGILWILFLAVLLYGNRFSNLYFSLSVAILLLINLFVTGTYIKHILLIKQIDYDQTVTAIQAKLAKLQTSTVQGTRIAWLQMPLYTTWFWHESWVNFTNTPFLLIALPITLFFALAGIYLYRNVTIDNMHKKWVRTLLMTGPEYSSVLKAKAFIEEIEAFKKNL